MKFTMTVRMVGREETWEEEEDRETDDAQKCAEGIVEYFNKTLRPGERVRELVKVEVTGPSTGHLWEKSLAAMSVQRPGDGGIYDGFFCRNCGITAKRSGLSAAIVRDSKYRAKKFEICSNFDVDS